LPLGDEGLPVATLEVEINCDFDQAIQDFGTGGEFSISLSL
jgi:hypothetical protein